MHEEVVQITSVYPCSRVIDTVLSSQLSVSPGAPQQEPEPLTHVETPTLQAHGWMSELGPEFLSVYILALNHNLM